MSVALQYAGRRYGKWVHWVLHGPEHRQFPPGKYLIAFFFAFLPLTPLMPRAHQIRPADPSALELSAIAATTIALPWLYWLLRCRRSIGAGWSVGLWTACVLITECHVAFFPGHSANSLYGAVAGLALLGALATSYARHLRARFGWSSLEPTDRFSITASSLLPLFSESIWAPHVHGATARMLLGALMLPIMTALTLNLIGACRMAIWRLERQMQTPGRHRASLTRRLLRRVADPTLAAYSSASTSATVGGVIVAFWWAIPAAGGSAGPYFLIGGSALIAVGPVIFQCLPAPKPGGAPGLSPATSASARQPPRTG